MPKVIIDGNVVENTYTVVAAEEAVPGSGNVLVALNTWQENKDALLTRGNVGVWLNSDETPDLLQADLEKLNIVAINFPVFADGRGFSYARRLREEFNFKGELRAIGDTIRDQLYFYKRCGFNAVALRDEATSSDAKASLNDFSVNYQGAVDQPQPLFRTR